MNMNIYLDNSMDNYYILYDEITNRFISLICFITKYNFNLYEKYKNMVKNIIKKFSFIQMYSIFYDMYNDNQIQKNSIVYKIINIYYSEIRYLLLEKFCI